MVEKSQCVYDKDNSSIPLVSSDQMARENGLIASNLGGASCPTVYVEFDGPASEGTNDRENIHVAGIGSAVIGLLVGGPILAVILGFGAAYAAETNEGVRNKVGEIWTKAKIFDKEHNFVKRGVNGIGKGTVWLMSKITGGHKHSNRDHVETWIASQ
jgi:hypothetical protein